MYQMILLEVQTYLSGALGNEMLNASSKNLVFNEFCGNTDGRLVISPRFESLWFSQNLALKGCKSDFHAAHSYIAYDQPWSPPPCNNIHIMYTHHRSFCRCNCIRKFWHYSGPVVPMLRFPYLAMSPWNVANVSYRGRRLVLRNLGSHVCCNYILNIQDISNMASGHGWVVSDETFHTRMPSTSSTRGLIVSRALVSFGCKSNHNRRNSWSRHLPGHTVRKEISAKIPHHQLELLQDYPWLRWCSALGLAGQGLFWWSCQWSCVYVWNDGIVRGVLLGVLRCGYQLYFCVYIR